jgi:hypothetical protein
MKHQLDFEKPILELQNKLDELRKHPEAHALMVNFEEEIALIEKKLAETRRQVFSHLTPWQRVQLARHPRRPFTLDYIRLAFSEFQELHGDRRYAEDRAVVGGFAKLDGLRVMVIGTQKGRDTKENILRNFGSAHPEGYRKALRLMRMADKFGLPIVTLIDTAGAYPGFGAERERLIAEGHRLNLRGDDGARNAHRGGGCSGEAVRAARWASAWRTGVDFGKCYYSVNQPVKVRGHPVERPGGRPRAAEGPQDHGETIYSSWGWWMKSSPTRRRRAINAQNRRRRR